MRDMAWTESGQHTGRTDLSLTPGGERNAKQLEERLKGTMFTVHSFSLAKLPPPTGWLS